MEKATPVYPPGAKITIDADGKHITSRVLPELEPDVIEVNMTTYVVVTTTLAITTVGLTAAVVKLWRRTKRNTELIEALGDYTAKLVNETDCGSEAYQLLVDGAAADDVVDFSEDHAPYPMEQELHPEGDA
jgi:hypothetical protein